MKLKELIRKEIKTESDKALLQLALSKTKWLQKYKPEDITLELLEKLYYKLTHKYPVRIGYIQNAGDDSFVCMLKHSQSHEWIETIYFIGFYECMAKVILVLYGYIVKGLKFEGEAYVNEG